MATCFVQAKPEMYGVGIRVAFYLQWFGSLWFNYADQVVLPDLRLSGLCLSGSMTLAVLIKSAERGLQPSEMYVMIVLATGSCMFLVPVYAWRAMTGCRCYWDPSYWTEEDPLRIYRVVNFITVFVGACVGVWFFGAYLPGQQDDACQQYGFFFGQISLRDCAFIVLNSMLHVAVATICLLILRARCRTKLRTRSDTLRRRRRRRREKYVPSAPVSPIPVFFISYIFTDSYSHVRLLSTLNFVSDCSVWAILIVTIELSIEYNNLSASNEANATTQLFALFASLGACLRAYWLHVVDTDARDGGEEQVRHERWPMSQADWLTLAEYQRAINEARRNGRRSRHRR
ncbi:hypothetical protein ED733_000897 [Metarhizium rileyi]|uniref:Uncharacterized protein n=1 Tax=Metarhizium rileyi (strain RCEF 4871) TaxID=1649241 RepID=A0A5C6G3X3_METRR|nr:hypothetical protein ED733_000897 [Metarhizium rileyi]